MRSNYSRKERQKIVEEYIQSGKSQTVFAPEYGIKPNTLSAWVTKYKSAEASRLLKIIFWNKTGFWLAQKRLEMATWPWPNTSQEAREFTSKTESLKKLYESQPFLFDAEEMGIKLENQCPEISDEDIAQALNDDDLFDRKSERKKPGRTRNKSKNLPRQKYVIDLSEEEKICSNCGAKIVKILEIVSERIVHVPSSEYIEEVHRYVYECQNCLDDNDKPVRKAAKEKRIIEHSLATPELLAHIFISKYMKHTPFSLKLFKDVFDNENRLRKLFDEEKISEADFLERRVKEVKPHMDNLHSWLLEKKQAERSVKSWVMARRNFLFSGSGNGVRASCFILSLIEKPIRIF